jgi:DNA-binding NarL/FixJ family response regulator
MPIKVLLACNDTATRDALRGALLGHGDIRLVGVVSQGQEAVEETVRLKPDVVVVDMSTSPMHGIDITRTIIEGQRDTAVLVVSKVEPGSLIKQALRAGARGYLFRESISPLLLKAVRALAKGKRYLGTGVADRVVDSMRPVRVDAMKGLTAAERQILRLAADGKSNAEMAGMLGLSKRTVETYRARLMRKLGIVNVSSLVKLAIRVGLTKLD